MVRFLSIILRIYLILQLSKNCQRDWFSLFHTASWESGLAYLSVKKRIGTEFILGYLDRKHCYPNSSSLSTSGYWSRTPHLNTFNAKIHNPLTCTSPKPGRAHTVNKYRTETTATGWSNSFDQSELIYKTKDST